MRYFVLASLFVCVLGGCATFNQPEKESIQIDRAPFVRTIVLCRTTLEELQRQLGEPSRDGLLHAQRVLSWITAWDPLVRYVAVLIDEQNVVVDLYWDVPSEIPWTPANQCLKDS